MRKLSILLALALLPAAALSQSLTLGNLKAPIAHASGKAPASSTADLWDQINHLPAPAATPAPIPATVEQRLDAIDTRLTALTAAINAVPAQAPVTTPTPTATPTPTPTTAYGAIAGMPDGFNAAFYLHANKDIADAGVSPLSHYLAYGRREGRQPYEGAPAAADCPTSTSALPPLVPGALWSWGPWMASDWASMGPEPYKFDHVVANCTDVVFIMDAQGGPQLKGYDAAPGADKTSGLWEADVTLPKMREGLIVAPLWLYNQDGGHELDFEFPGLGRGLDATLHVGGPTTDSSRLFAGRDLSGERHRFGIRMDQAKKLGEMYVDGVLVKTFDPSKGFPDKPMRPILEMWAADPNNGGFVGWAGKWQPLATGETLVMIVHGYRYTPL